MSIEEEVRDVAEATVRKAAWKGWVWSVPIAALILIVYLVLRTILTGGTSITITFPSAEGLTGKAETPVLYRGFQVGAVQSIELRKDLGGVIMHVSMNRNVKHALRTGTRFWIVQPSPLTGDFSALLAGPTLAMEPGPGRPERHFTGLLQPPPEQPSSPGVTVVAYAPRSEGVSQGAPVMFRGLHVGHVLGTTFDSTAGDVRIHIFVRAPYDRRVGRDARFWSCGGVQLSSADGGVGLHITSIQGLLEGCVAFDTFAKAATRTASDGSYRLYTDEEDARSAFTATPVPVRIWAPGSIEGLDAGAPVVLEGKRVGVVRRVRLEVGRNGISTPVDLEFDPGAFGIPSAASAADSAKAVYRVLDRLVHDGLRAQLVSSSLVLGSQEISLVMTGRRTGARLDRSADPPVLPAMGGGNLQSVIAQIGEVADAIDSIPFARLGEDARRASPKLVESLDHLNQALVALDSVTAAARSQVGPTLAQTRQTVNEFESAVRALNGISGGSLRNQESLPDLVREMTQAARSLRELGDYLSEHPDALIWGRSKGR